MPMLDTEVAVVGGGVVGCSVAHALTRRGVACTLLEAEGELGLGASGTNSGIMHTGFDSSPGELETQLILAGARLREGLLAELGVSVWRCGAVLSPRNEPEREAVRSLARNAAGNGVEVHLRADGSLEVPGEGVSDPVAFVLALAAASSAGGCSVRLQRRVVSIEPAADGAIDVGTAAGERVCAAAVVNCAGLFADDVARLAGESPVSVYPRKGEFLVFRPPAGLSLERILLPVPSSLGKGVLVFPTLDGHIVAGPTAREREDKHDWSVEPDAEDLIMPRALAMYPQLEHATLVGSYAGLRPAGRAGNYVIEGSPSMAGLVHVAAIRSTGLSASLAIGRHVATMLEQRGVVTLSAERELPAPGPVREELPWWQRTARHRSIDGGDRL